LRTSPLFKNTDKESNSLAFYFSFQFRSHFSF
jgi:hypothetical protein